MSNAPNTDLNPTRRSLITRLKNWDNQESWREFFSAYWQLIYAFAVRSGLNDAEAQEVVQETLITVAREMKGFKYDPARGSFKSWLLLVTKRRVADQMRKRYRAMEVGRLNPDDTAVANEIQARAEQDIPGPDDAWDEEWRQQMATAALDRLRAKVKPAHFQIFEMYVLRGQSGSEVAAAFGVSLMTVYLIKHRLSTLLRKEAVRLEKAAGGGQQR